MKYIYFLKQNIQKKSSIKNIILVFFVMTTVCCAITTFFWLKPISIEGQKIIIIPKGYSIIKTGQLLEEEGLISEAKVFRLIAQSQKISVKAGSYLFQGRTSVFAIVDRLGRADYGDVYVALTIPEGSTNEDIINIVRRSGLDIDDIKLRNLIYGKEGFLFPDTYSLFPTDTEVELVNFLEQTFLEKYKKAQQESTIQKSQQDIVIMASIIEKEAGNNREQKQIIAGILWKRIADNIRLQVDAPFLYERQKGSAQLTHGDLQTDSPYNTYTRSGLIPTPIGNPGYDSLYAAMHPISSPYYFYLHAPDGAIYYAQTYDDHLKNIRMHLR